MSIFSEKEIKNAQNNPYYIIEKGKFEGTNSISIICATGNLQLLKKRLSNINDINDINDINNEEENILMISIINQADNYDCIKYVIENTKIDINYLNSHKYSAFTYACKYNNLEVATLLLDKNIKVYNYRTEDNKLPIAYITNEKMNPIILRVLSSPERIKNNQYNEQLPSLNSFTIYDYSDFTPLQYNNESSGSYGVVIPVISKITNNKLILKKYISCNNTLIDEDSLKEIFFLSYINSIDKSAVKLYGITMLNNCIYLVLELLTYTFTDIIKIYAIIDHKDKYEFFRDIFYHLLKNVSTIHSCGIFHSDLKSDNIMIDNNNYPKIIDFGLAKFLALNPDKNLIYDYKCTHYTKSFDFTTHLSKHDIKPKNGVLILNLDGTDYEFSQNYINYSTDVFSLGQIFMESIFPKHLFARTYVYINNTLYYRHTDDIANIFTSVSTKTIKTLKENYHGLYDLICKMTNIDSNVRINSDDATKHYFFSKFINITGKPPLHNKTSISSDIKIDYISYDIEVSIPFFGYNTTNFNNLLHFRNKIVKNFENVGFETEYDLINDNEFENNVDFLLNNTKCINIDILINTFYIMKNILNIDKLTTQIIYYYYASVYNDKYVDISEIFPYNYNLIINEIEKLDNKDKLMKMNIDDLNANIKTKLIKFKKYKNITLEDIDKELILKNEKLEKQRHKTLILSLKLIKTFPEIFKLIPINLHIKNICVVLRLDEEDEIKLTNFITRYIVMFFYLFNFDEFYPIKEICENICYICIKNTKLPFNKNNKLIKLIQEFSNNENIFVQKLVGLNFNFDNYISTINTKLYSFKDIYNMNIELNSNNIMFKFRERDLFIDLLKSNYNYLDVNTQKYMNDTKFNEIVLEYLFTFEDIIYLLNCTNINIRNFILGLDIKIEDKNNLLKVLIKNINFFPELKIISNGIIIKNIYECLLKLTDFTFIINVIDFMNGFNLNKIKSIQVFNLLIGKTELIKYFNIINAKEIYEIFILDEMLLDMSHKELLKKCVMTRIGNENILEYVKNKLMKMSLPKIKSEDLDYCTYFINNNYFENLEDLYIQLFKNEDKYLFIISFYSYPFKIDDLNNNTYLKQKGWVLFSKDELKLLPYKISVKKESKINIKSPRSPPKTDIVEINYETW